MVDERKRVTKLFDQLIERGEDIKRELKRLYFSGNKKSINTEMYETWRTSCLTLLKSTFSSSSPHYDRFVNLKVFDYYNATQIYLGILKSAKEDIEKGYFYHKDLMLSVNIYDSLLFRSYEYVEKGDLAKAFGVMEAVILEAMTKMLEYKNVNVEREGNTDRLAKMLLEREVIDQLAYERISDVAGRSKLTNNELNKEKLENDIKWAQSFIYEYLGSKILIIN